jgi:hypothetical protein
MKSYTYNYSFFTYLLVALLCFNLSTAQESDVTNYKMRFSFKTVKQADNTRLLEVKFIGQHKKDRKDLVPIFEAEINFYNSLNDEEILLGSSKTSEEGIAQLILPENQKYLFDEDGAINLIARFNGSETIDEQEESITIKDIKITLDLKEVDSVKTVFAKAFTIDSLGVETPVAEAEMLFFVQGMLSKLKIIDGEISDGEFEFEFPTNIPGDADGDVTIIASIEDNEEFGNAIQHQTIKWGSHVIEPVTNVKNTLWSEAAPLWMYIVLTFLLVGVWANYVYTITNLFKIKKEGVS